MEMNSGSRDVLDRTCFAPPSCPQMKILDPPLTSYTLHTCSEGAHAKMDRIVVGKRFYIKTRYRRAALKGKV